MQGVKILKKKITKLHVEFQIKREIQPQSEYSGQILDLQNFVTNAPKNYQIFFSKSQKSMQGIKFNRILNKISMYHVVLKNSEFSDTKAPKKV